MVAILLRPVDRRYSTMVRAPPRSSAATYETFDSKPSGAPQAT